MSAGWDVSKLGDCAAHGRFSGSACPLCPVGGIPEPSPSETPAEPEEDRSNWWPGLEGELHELFATDCLRRGVEIIRSRMDKKSTIEDGWPDFSCFYAGADADTRACFIEFKNRTGRLRKDQVIVIDRLRKAGLPVLVTGDFAEAVAFLKTHIIKDNAHAQPTT